MDGRHLEIIWDDNPICWLTSRPTFRPSRWDLVIGDPVLSRGKDYSASRAAAPHLIGQAPYTLTRGVVHRDAVATDHAAADGPRSTLKAAEDYAAVPRRQRMGVQKQSFRTAGAAAGGPPGRRFCHKSALAAPPRARARSEYGR